MTRCEATASACRLQIRMVAYHEQEFPTDACRIAWFEHEEASPLRRGVRIAIRSVAAVLLVAVAMGTVLRTRYERRLGNESDRLFAASGPETASIVSNAELNGLPEPVQLWLRASGIVG